MSADEAYRRCEEITRRTAGNFYYGIRLLPTARRRGMCAVYAFARRVDDIGDGTLAPEEKLRGLDAQAQALGWLARDDGARATAPGDAPAGTPRGSDGDPVMVALGDAYERFRVPPDALQALIEGVRMDVEGVAYEGFDDLVLYCRRVAGAIGRACLAIFGLGEADQGTREHAAGLADDLGVALQLTNILRDLREDAENGRVYLPAHDLRRFGLVAPGEERDAPARIAALASVAGAAGAADGSDGADGAGAREAAGRGHGEEDLDRLCALMRFEADRARGWFDRGIGLTELLDRRSAACVLAMASIYGILLTRIEDDPRRALGERIALGAHEKAWVAARSLFVGFAGGRG